VKTLARYLLGISLGLNQLVNAATGGRADETVSSRAAAARAHGSHRGAAVCRVLDAFDFHKQRPDEDHCQKALRHQRERAAAQVTVSPR
jgi:hypothetical protein